MMLRINIIGAGKLGQAMGKLLMSLPDVCLSVCNRTMASAALACQQIGGGQAYGDIRTMPDADMILITTGDNDIQNVAEQLAAVQGYTNASVIHFSGALSSDILRPLAQQGASIASCHPMRSFAKPLNDISEFAGTMCAIEGDSTACQHIQSLMMRLQGVTFYVDKQEKASYHAAGVFASNYLLALIEAAHRCLDKAGVKIERQKDIILSLMQGTLDNYQMAKTPVEALTGPVARGDNTTIDKHVMALSGSRELLPLYQGLGRFLVNEVAELSHEKKSTLMNCLKP